MKNTSILFPGKRTRWGGRAWTAIALAWLGCFAATAQTPVTVTVNKNNVLQRNFGGLGFNVPVDETVDQHTWNTVVGKRLKEVSVGSYVRVFSDVSSFAPTKGNYTWNSPGQQAWDRMMTLLKANDTDVFVTNGYWGTQPPFLGGNREITNADTLADWVEVQLAGLNQWVNVKGFTNIRQWTVTNEFNSFDAFDATRRANWFRHARLVHNGLAGRNLAGKVEVTGTDALGRVDPWRATLPEAVAFHNDLFPRYEVHDYPQTDAYWLQDANGNWFQDDDGGAGYLAATNYEKKMKKFIYARYLIRSTGKDMIIGEFGGTGTNEDLGPDGKRETYPDHDKGEFGNFVVDYALAGLNTGIQAMAYWWFHDTGQEGTGQWTFFNDTGAMADERGNWQTRPEYYAYGLVGRYVRKNSAVYETTSSNSLVHVAAVQHNADGKYALIVNNRETQSINLSLTLPGETGKFRKFVYNPASVPTNGDLPRHAAEVQVSAGALTDQIGAGQVVVYTNEFDETAPAAVTGVSATGKTLTWSASAAGDLSYYRIYRSTAPITSLSGATQVGSTLAADYTDNTPAPGGATALHYVVTAVDKYGNESPLSASTRAAVRALTAASTCIPNPNTQREWRITNPNLIAVSLHWSISGTSQSGTFTAAPGTSSLLTARGGTNNLTLSWRNENNGWQTATAAAPTAYCPETVTDELQDWTVSSEHTAGWYFDTSVSTAFPGDASRIVRGATSTERIVYRFSNIRNVSADVYYHTAFGGTVKFYTSANNVNYAELPVNYSQHLTSGGWALRTYAPSGSLPENTNYVKIEVSGGSQSWTPQLGRVRVSYLPATYDPLNDWSKSFSHGGFYFDTSGGASNDWDNSVAVRHNLTPESIVYNKPNITDVSVKLIYHTTFPATVKYYTSPDNSTYTPLAMLLTSAPTAGGFYRYTYAPGGALPAGTNYFKIEISGGSQAWATRVAEVNLKHSPLATARIAAGPEAARAEALSVFPNPAAGDVTVVYYAAAAGAVSLSVADALGRPHLTRQLEARAGENRETLRLGTLKRGLYTIQVRSLTGTPRTVKVLVTQ